MNGLRAWIATAPPGAKVPTNRELMREYGAGPVTVQKAMHALNALGLVESRPGVGTFVRAVRAPRAADFGWQTAALGAPHARLPIVSSTQRSAAPDAISLHSGYPDRELLPERMVRAALSRAAKSEAALTRSPMRGLPELQSWFAAELGATAPAGTAAPTARDVMIVSGSQSGLSSVFRSVVGPGRPLLIESPTYWGAILGAEQSGLTLVPIPSGPEGPDPEELDRAFRQTGARAFYAQPTFANPTGVQWSPRRGREVLAVVREHGAFLIEDDWAHDLAIDAEPAPLAAHDDGGHVIYLRSLTKSVSPALRVAAVVARGPVRDRIVADQGSEAMYVSGVLQAAALDVVTQPGWRNHLRGFRNQVRLRRDLLIDALSEHTPGAALERVPAGGLNLWLRVPEGTDVERLVRDCDSRGLLIAPGTEWFPAEAAGPYVRVNFAGPAPDRFPEAARLLQAGLEEQS
ncbi:PLP-dependent aminotransferase family protein [Glycomyces luteolus]|uniref:PLP-dependent aminotransferase family protein n=1 Tax=Glycomyces luteolus TaxID=2670330 RepID=A0A9X3PFV1_9ACTN|nr:PLP-dependent aminotransferase family protein [Glycomyces luteolus]MDA1361834.1 PLP-dependent aminotransferase family protein [Glycomyces luteolus]